MRTPANRTQVITAEFEAKDAVERDGFAVVPNVLTLAQIDRLRSVLDDARDIAQTRRTGAVYGVRNLLDVAEVSNLAADPAIRRFIEPIGAWDRYDTITGYRVTPIVGLVEPGFTLKLDPREVASVFEAPLDFLMNGANHEVREAQWQGRTRYYYVMPYEGHNIWGATAGMVRALYERLYV